MHSFPSLAQASSGDCEPFSDGASRAEMFRLIGVNSATAFRSLRLHPRIVLDPEVVVNWTDLPTGGFRKRCSVGRVNGNLPRVILMTDSNGSLLSLCRQLVACQP